MLISVLSACILCAVAESMMPKGPMRQVGTLVCGLVLLCAVLTPVVELDWGVSTHWLEECRTNMEVRKEDLEYVVQQEWKTVIEAECATYIEDKAAELGIRCSAHVTCREGADGTWLPERVVLSGVPETAERGELTRILEQELKIPVTCAGEEPA